MDDLLAHIHIFKTNIGKENLSLFKKVFGKNKAIRQWHIDTDDCDLVLRVVSHDLSEADIISLVSRHGFECADLA